MGRSFQLISGNYTVTLILSKSNSKTVCMLKMEIISLECVDNHWTTHKLSMCLRQKNLVELCVWGGGGGGGGGSTA